MAMPAVDTTLPTLNPALRKFWRTPARNRVLYGGRSSSKSWDAAGFATFLTSNYKLRFLCTRQFQNKIDESVYTLLKVQIERFGLRAEFDIQRTKIIHPGTGSEFLFYGLWRHIDEIKSLEGIDVCWIEEGHNLTEEQWRVLEPTLRNENSQFWLIFNPRLVTDFVWKRFVVNPPPDTVKRRINYNENPFLSKTILKVIEALKAEDPDAYQNIYGGEPLQDDSAAIIKRSWLLACIDAHKVLGFAPSGKKKIGFDVADDGRDLNATVHGHGNVALDLEEWKGLEDELPKSASRVYSLAASLGAEITYDSIGVGAFAGGHFKNLNDESGKKVAYFKFNAGGEVVRKKERIDPNDPKAPLNQDYWSNLKAQAWGHASLLARNTYNAVKAVKEGKDWREELGFSDDDVVSISSACSKLEGLIDELATPRRDYDNRGKTKVESKKDLDKRDVPSPNKADAFVMWAWPNREFVPPVGSQGYYGITGR